MFCWEYNIDSWLSKSFSCLIKFWKMSQLFWDSGCINHCPEETCDQQDCEEVVTGRWRNSVKVFWGSRLGWPLWATWRWHQCHDWVFLTTSTPSPPEQWGASPRTNPGPPETKSFQAMSSFFCPLFWTDKWWVRRLTTGDIHIQTGAATGLLKRKSCKDEDSSRGIHKSRRTFQWKNWLAYVHDGAVLVGF